MRSDRPLVLFNPRAGLVRGERGRQRLAEALAASKTEADVVSIDQTSFEKVLAEHDPRASRLIVAAGGDGTVRSIAEAVVGTERALGVIPLGTRNHFARDAGLPLAIEEAIASLCEGPETRVDTGEVAGRLFLNNASLGLYPIFVEERRRRSRFSARWSAIVGSAWWVLAQHRRLRVHIDQDAETRTSIVFIGNNRYEPEGLRLGRRRALDRGELMLVTVDPSGPWSAMHLLLRAVSGSLAKEEKAYQHRCAQTIDIDTRRHHLRVALDGEPLRLRPPLHFRSRPASLRLRGVRTGA